ncbi:IclR family transcriptional regulator [Rhodococcus koreensis]|uniref:IclR family transcriptional regulator n=1 Tax=Rhodococcus koreensis TaxID=99653 RepID=UPI00366FF1D6
MNSPRTSSTAASALRLLRLLAAHPEGMRLTDAAAELAVGKSSAHVLMSTLVDQGFADHLPNGRYALGLGAFEVGISVPDAVRFGGEVARPMQLLADQSGEAVSLAVPRGRYAIMVQRFESRQILRAEIRVGTRMPMFACASGKFLLAQMAEDEINSLFPEAELVHDNVTESTIRTKTDLLDELKQVREDGYATNTDEYVFGIHGIGTGVKNYDDSYVGALSIAGPSGRFNATEWVQPLFDAAAQMTEILTTRSHR